ncbi:MAG: dihydropteroate synthase [Euryarchaeota archaeon]|nr:dihydropteroate synthase [Euryarchaeota archaeon]
MRVDLGGRAFAEGVRLPALMGVVNVTPDSFHPGSRSLDPSHAVSRGISMIDEGASIIDIGGESTRPGAMPVGVGDELSRTIPVIEGILHERPDAFMSVDTSKPRVASEALRKGCRMINDVTGAENEEMIDLIADAGAQICVMHMKGEPRTMQVDPGYDDVVSEVGAYLSGRVNALVEAGIPPRNILVDPGIGFGKRLEDNIALLKAGREVVPREDVRLLWGVSRKRMFLDLLGRKDSNDRLFGTLGVAASAVCSGVDVLRVHDVLEHADLLKAMTSTIGGQ